MRHSLDVPLHLNGHSSRCKWCLNLLAPARRTWKVRDGHRYYCSELCFLQGEERQTRDAAQLASTVHLHWTATLAVILSILMVALIFIEETRARAQDVDGTVHQKHSGPTPSPTTSRKTGRRAKAGRSRATAMTLSAERKATAVPHAPTPTKTDNGCPSRASLLTSMRVRNRQRFSGRRWAS
jgi:hypothetical protein